MEESLKVLPRRKLEHGETVQLRMRKDFPTIAANKKKIACIKVTAVLCPCSCSIRRDLEEEVLHWTGSCRV